MRLTVEELKKRILFEDGEILVLDKPAGTAVESARVTEPDLVSLLHTYLAKPVYVVHRLDQPVRGVMVFAKTSRAAAALSAQASGEISIESKKETRSSGKASCAPGESRMRKLYRARVSGPVPQEEGTLIDYLIRDPRTNTSRVVGKEGEHGTDIAHAAGKDATHGTDIAHAAGKDAVHGANASPAPGKNASHGDKLRGRAKRAELHYRKTGEREVEVELVTGRHHQIRVQLAHAGMPVEGDRKYGGAPAESLGLTASRLTFHHPKTGEELTFEIEPERPEER